MKRLLLPLLAALALPTAVIAEPIYLECELIRLDDKTSRTQVSLTLNESQSTVSYIVVNGGTNTLPATFNQTSILFANDLAKWQLNRTTGEIFRQITLGIYISPEKGSCKKAEKTKTLF